METLNPARRKSDGGVALVPLISSPAPLHVNIKDRGCSYSYSTIRCLRHPESHPFVLFLTPSRASTQAPRLRIDTPYLPSFRPQHRHYIQSDTLGKVEQKHSKWSPTHSPTTRLWHIISDSSLQPVRYSSQSNNSSHPFVQRHMSQGGTIIISSS